MAKRYKFSQDAEEIRGLLNKIDSLDLNQQCRCSQSCELENIKLDNVVYSVITRAVSNLINYYTKSEVDTKLSSIHQFVTRQVDVLPKPSASTMYALYFVPSENRSAGNVTDEFITINRNGSYVWEQIGASPVDLSGYVTDDELNSILSDYVSSDDFSNAISELSSRIDGLHEVKYIEQQLTNAQKSQARNNIGATAPEVFWAVYDETPYAEVINAYNSGKLCACLYQGHIYYLSSVRINQAHLDDIVYFDELGGSFNDGSTTLTIFVRADNSWDDETGYYVVGEDDATTWNEKYTKPSTGIPASDLADGVIPNVSQFITKTVNDLVNYYTKSETYTKAEVGQMFSALSNGAFVPVAELPTASAETFGLKIYLVPSANPAVENLKDEFITTRSGEEGSYAYAWEQIGSTAVDLSGYVTTEALNTVLASYVTSEAFTTALAAKADRAQNAVEGDLANLDANGNPVDSGLAFKAIPRLPEEYQEVERIGSPNSNAKVIDTGVPGNIAGLEIEAKINYPKYLSAVGYLWGNARGGSYNGFYCLKQSRTSTVYNFSINKRYSVGVTISPHEYNTVHTLRLFPDSSAYRLVVDGEGDGYIIGNTSEGQENNKTILLFGSYSSPRVAATATVYFYYFIARANGVELCHLIPAVRKADNAYGLYDLVSGTFKMGGETAEETHYYNIGDLVTTASAQRLVKGETPMPVKTDIKRVDGLTEEIARIDGRIDAAAARDYLFAVVGETSYAAVQSAMQEGKRVIAFKDVEGQYGVGTTVFTPFFANDFECIFMGVEAVDETRFGLRFLVLGSSGWQEDTYETLDRVFWAEFGVTTAAEIDAAVAAGKAVFCNVNNRQYSLGLLQAGNYITFGIIYGGSSYYLLLNRTNNAWSQGSNSLENTSNRSQSVETDKTSTAKYPSVKAVYDVVVEATDEEIDEMMESVLN